MPDKEGCKRGRVNEPQKTLKINIASLCTSKNDIFLLPLFTVYKRNIIGKKLDVARVFAVNEGVNERKRTACPVYKIGCFQPVFQNGSSSSSSVSSVHRLS